MIVNIPRSGMHGLGDAGTDSLIAASLQPITNWPVTLDESGCPGGSFWVNNSVTNAQGTNKNCLVDYWTGQTIQVNPNDGTDAAGRPFYCHMPAYSGGPKGASPGLIPWICGTPAERAATPNLQAYYQQHHMPDPSDPYALFKCQQDPICAANYLPKSEGGTSNLSDYACASDPTCNAYYNGTPGSAPPANPTPIQQQIASFTASSVSTPTSNVMPVAGPAAQMLMSASPQVQSAAFSTPAPAASATASGLSTQEILILAGVAALGLFLLKGRSV